MNQRIPHKLVIVVDDVVLLYHRLVINVFLVTSMILGDLGAEVIKVGNGAGSSTTEPSCVLGLASFYLRRRRLTPCLHVYDNRWRILKEGMIPDTGGESKIQSVMSSYSLSVKTLVPRPN